MKTLCGTIAKNDLEGGFWELRTAEGKSYQLSGGDPQLRVQGQNVEISGSIEENTMSFAMSGPLLKVHDWKKTE